jgi:hypothetical protein
MVGTSELRLSQLLPYLQAQDPFAEGPIDPASLGGDVARIAKTKTNLQDGIDNEQELRELMQLLQTTDGDLNGLPRPDFQNLGGMTSADMLQALIDWIQSGGPEANKKISRPAPVGNLSTPQNYSSQPASWNGSGGGSSGGSSGVSGGGGTTSSGAGGPSTTAPGKTYPPDQIAKNIKDAKHVPLTDAERADVAWDKLSPEAREAAEVAKGMGLTVTSGAEGHPGDGVHTETSNHYSGNAIDVSGDPDKMSLFYQTMAQVDPQARELFYDPLGAIKDGSSISPIGGHGDHVHYAPSA